MWFRPKKPTSYWENFDKFKKDHKPDIVALQALYRGDANAIQQKRALAFIIKYLCQADEINYFPDPYDHSFMSGRESVGKIIRGLCLDSDYVEGDNDEREPRSSTYRTFG